MRMETQTTVPRLAKSQAISLRVKETDGIGFIFRKGFSSRISCTQAAYRAGDQHLKPGLTVESQGVPQSDFRKKCAVSK